MDQTQDPLINEKHKGDDIVISGISTLVPECNNMTEFAEKLYNKENFIKRDNSRWKNVNHPELSPYFGKISELGKFDAQYFMVNYRLACTMDVITKEMMKQSYQAIFDSGISPSDLWGKRVGVYVNNVLCEADGMIECKNISLGVLGCSNAMFSNRISYYLNLKGPSITMLGSCTGSITALQKAIEAIKSGECDSAIVGAGKLVLHPTTSIMYQKTVPLSPDGKTRSYDEAANGHVVSEALIVMYLQKQKDAKRVYTTVCHAKSHFVGPAGEDCYGESQGPYRHLKDVVDFLRDFYDEAGVSPSQVDYIEGFGAALPGVDKTELEAIDEIFCKNRSSPVLVGSIMSNIGYTEAASGLCSIAKLILAYQRGQIAANLNCTNPRRDVAALRDGRIEIVTEHTKFNRLYSSINSFSLAGHNGHVLLKGPGKLNAPSRYSCNYPCLLLVSGRKESAVKRILDDIKSRTLDPEEIGLLHNIFRVRTSNHLSRGFGIYYIFDLNGKIVERMFRGVSEPIRHKDLQANSILFFKRPENTFIGCGAHFPSATTENNETVSLCEKVDYYDELKRPLWFVYSGMGSQWAGMGVELMRLPIFATAIERCHKVLMSKGIDLIDIITTPDPAVFDNIMNSFVGIAAIQIALTDVLKALGLVPDNMIGHSTGEQGCAYADGCITAEEMILLAYFRGLVSIETPVIRGSMAAIGIGYKQIIKICPPDIEVACRNGPNSCTISGPAESVADFVATLTGQNIFAREVQCSNIAYHSQYIAELGPHLLKYTSHLIKTPKLRSHKWISTSIPENMWSEAAAAYCTAEYFSNNLLNPVLFEDILHHVPPNAVLVEIAPHGLLQAILKRSLPLSCRNYSITRRESSDSVQFLLEVVGRLYMEGYQLDVSSLYPKIEFPVSVRTRSLSHLVEWVENEYWGNFRYVCPERNYTAIYNQIINLYDDDYAYLRGHCFQGIKTYPFSAALISVWDTMAMTLNKKRRNTSVIFEDMKFYTQPQLFKHRALDVTVSLQRGCGRFEVTYGHDSQKLIADGFIKEVHNTNKYQNEESTTELTSEDIYKLMYERGYEYRDQFRSIHSANISMTHAKLIWNDNWVTLLDGMLQFDALRRSIDTVTQISHIRRMTINVKQHKTAVIHNSTGITSNTLLNARFDTTTNTISCGGLTINNTMRKIKPAVMRRFVTMKKLSFVPLIQEEKYDKTWDDEYYVPANYEIIPTGNISLKSKQLGDFDSLKWKNVSEKPVNGVHVNVHYAGLNCNDTKRASNDINNNRGYGMDFSGVTERGERVMGLTSTGSARTMICANPKLLWPVPKHWSLEDAATVPMAYAHAFYCFVMKSNLQPGMIVLIHGGAGALGQAAISIALAYKCEVFTTVSDIHKKQFLMKMFPELKEDHIDCSRDLSFGDMVMILTKGYGCDIILNCVHGNLKHISLKCCAHCGVTIDTVQLPNHENYDFGLKNLMFSRSYKIIDFSSVLTNENTNDIALLQSLVSEGISCGYVRPLSRVTYAAREAARALRLLAASRHRGRVLLRLPTGPASAPQIPQHCRPYSNISNGYQIIFCDKQDFGVQLADKLIKSGARKLQLHCSHPSGYLDYKKLSWIKLGIEIQISNAPLSNDKNVEKFIRECGDLNKVDAIHVVTTGALDDFSTAKINTTLKSLDLVSRKHCPQLRYFTVISDNTIGRDVVINRFQSGLPSVFIQLHTIQNLNGKKGNYPLIAWNEALDEIEKGIFSKDRIIKAMLQYLPAQTMMEEMAQITGVAFNDPLLEKQTMRQLGIDINASKELSNILGERFNLSVNEETMLDITVSQLKDLQEKFTDPQKDIKGFGALYTMIDFEEIDSTLELVLMHTLPQSTDRRSDELERGLSYLCIVPGLEGHYHRFEQLCNRLKVPAVVLQPGNDRPNDSVPEMAQRLVNVITKRLKPKEHFYLLGYELGVMIVLEMAKILESLGSTGTVYLLGGTPNNIRDSINIRLTSIGDEWEDALIIHMYSLMTGIQSPDFEYQLKQTKSWDQKVNRYLKELRSKVTLSTQYILNQIETAHLRLKLLRRYTSSVEKLRSKIVILKANMPNHLREENLGLLSTQEVLLYNLEATLTYAPQDLRCTAIINKCLEPDVIEEFVNSNQCVTELLSGNMDTYIRIY